MLMHNNARIAAMLMLVAICLSTTAQSLPGPQPGQQPGPQPDNPGYFTGKWSCKYLGRKSPFGDGQSQGTAVFSAHDCADCPAGTTMLDLLVTYQTPDATGAEQAVTSFDRATGRLKIASHPAPGLIPNGEGDWSAPNTIRISSETFTVGLHGYRLRRLLSIVSNDSFTVFDELAESDGPSESPFERLGSAVCLRVKN